MEDVVIQLQQDPSTVLTGNFCVITHNEVTGEIQLRNDRYRSFPLFVGHRTFNNLIPEPKVVWTDGIIDIDQDLEISRYQSVDVIGTIDISPLDWDTAVDIISQRLHEKTKGFLKNNTLPIRAHLTGGVDSALVFSFLQSNTKDYQLIRYRHIDYDRFWILNQGDLSKFWGYTQIHHWDEPCVLTSGAPGDEFTLRSPVTIDMFLKYHGLDLLSLMATDTWKDCLHVQYFSRPEYMEIFQGQTVDRSVSQKDMYWQLCNIILNDWQHWHIGNTLTWTPLRDIEIFKTLLRMPMEDCLGQIFDSRTSKRMISSNNPDLVRVISNKKNAGNYMTNLLDFLDQHAV